MHRNNLVTVAVVQAAPVIMEREATVEKLISLTNKAAENGAKIVLFPESFIPAYPRGMTFGTAVGSRSEAGREDWLRYWRNSIAIPSETINILRKTAGEQKIYLAVGITERASEFGRGTLYCTTVYFGPDGSFLGKHRKVKPTGSERLIWGEGDGSTLTVFETPYGGIGGLICWENLMPLVRTAMYAKGVSVYLAPTADDRETWQSIIRHIAMEGRCFVLSCNQYVTKDMYPEDLACYNELMSAPRTMSRGGSAIINPYGKYVAGPTFDKEDMLIAELNLKEIVKSRYDFDVVGHYARPDVFQLTVDERKRDPVEWKGEVSNHQEV
jgi:nitrilase